MEKILKNFDGIDIMKFIMAILVVVLHAHPLKDVNEWWDFLWCQGITRVAVPFFFLTAGYFLFRKIELGKIDFSRVGKYVKHLFILYVAWSVLYLPMEAYHQIKNYAGMVNLARTEIFHFIYNGFCYHLWFMPALILAVLVVSFLMYKGLRIETIFLLSLPFYGVALLGRSYYGVMEAYIGEYVDNYYVLSFFLKNYPINGLTMGVPFVALGAYLAHKSVDRFGGGNSVYLIVCSMLMLGECYFSYINSWCNVSGTAYIFQIPVVVGIFILGCQISLPDREKLCRHLRNLSMLIYFIHPWFLFIFGVVSHKILPLHSMVTFILTMAGTLLTAELLLKLRNTGDIR